MAEVFNAEQTEDVERPVLREVERHYGSDAIADAIRALDIPYVALNPGASYRGLHDSIVNRLGNEAPQILLCLHEEAAVAIAHGFAKVTGRPMLAAVHSNVGLMHATMAVFNAWCDRAPLVLLGATGPVDAAHRRPWIDWIHTARDQGALVRHYVKWDDQPASPAAAREAIWRGAWLAQTAPMGPVYINLDADIQEVEIDPLPPLDPQRFLPEVASGVAGMADLAQRLRAAERPVILAGRVSRREADWNRRVALAEALGARVVTNLKLAAAFPSDHPLHAGTPSTFVDAEAARAINEADVVVSLDWIDLAGTIRSACKRVDPEKFIVQISRDYQIHNGWSMDHQAHPAADLFVAADADDAVRALLSALGEGERVPEPAAAPEPLAAEPEGAGNIVPGEMARALRAAVGDDPVSLLHVPTSWNGADWPFRHPLDYLGSEGGGGIGGGPGIAVGAALALKGSGRLPIALLGDGDYLMGVTALWTAVHYRIPMLVVVTNNQSFYNDEVHQKAVAEMRGRPVENKWIGQRMVDPELDLAMLARGQGAHGIGPVTSRDALASSLRQGIGHVKAGGVAVVDVRVTPGYTSSMRAALRGQDSGR